MSKEVLCTMNTDLQIMKNRAKLHKLIKDNEPYEKILEQSKKLDTLILPKFIALNNYRKVS